MAENNESPERPFGLHEAPDSKDLGPVLTRPEAVQYLGIEPNRLELLAEQFGVGRRYLTEPEPDWYYAKSDLDEIKDGIARGEATGAPAKKSNA